MKAYPAVLFHWRVLFSAATARAAAATGAADAPPAWDDLGSVLSSPDLLKEGGFDAWVSECVAPLEDEWTTPCAYPPFTDCNAGGAFIMGPSNYRFIDRPQDANETYGGQCMVFGQNCAHRNCRWPYTAEEEADLVLRGVNSHPDELNLPARVVFPASAGDVVHAVAFAVRNGVEVKVKSTGHSSFGDSTGRDSLLIHMRNFPKYADPDNGEGGLDAIVECDSSAGTAAAGADSSSDVGSMLCNLATARGLSAYMRVGGGQIFDEVLRTVNNWNLDETKANEYHIVSGASGTVGSSGGWLQGGGLGLTQNGRTFGFGIDGVLQLEMVLPGGEHVRFGPAEWTGAPRYQQPKTTKVRGFCNSNPHETDEAKWEWKECTESMPFDDLWFAVRGGGGASYGIVTAVYYQLQDKPGDMELAVIGPFPENAKETLTPVWVDFYLDFFVDPDSIGVTAEQSNGCGSYIGIHSFATTRGSVFFCFDGAGRVFTSAWNDYVLNRTDSLTSAGLTMDEIMAAANATFIMTFPSYPYFALNLPEAFSSLQNQNTPEGRVADLNPGVFIHRGFTGMGMFQVPTNIVLEKKSALSSFITSIVLRVGTAKAYQIGGNHLTAHDQMSAMPPASRNAAFLLEVPEDDDKAVLFELIFGEGASGDNFPGLYCHNIALQNDWGPQKNDWSKPCTTSWSKEEKNEKCIPFQEAVWGTELLEKLEGIKSAVDPKSLFVQGYGVKGPGPNQEVTEPTESYPPSPAPVDAPTETDPPSPAPAAPTEPEPKTSGSIVTTISSLGWIVCLAATGALFSRISS